MSKDMERKTPKIKAQRSKSRFLWKAVGVFLVCLTFTLGIVLRAAFSFIDETLNIDFEEFWFTITSPLKGANTNIVADGFRARLPAVACALAAFIAVYAFFLLIPKFGVLTLQVKFYQWVRSFDLWKFFRGCIAIASIVVLLTSMLYVDEVMGVRSFIGRRMTPTTLYEDYYVSPELVEITGSGKNLIYIYMESMETTYASQDVGGGQPDVNYIPYLTDLAMNNLSFSNSEQLGGFHQTTGAKHTVSALFATTTGLPFNFPGAKNSFGGKYDRFAGGVTSLGDILSEKGYQNEFLCGSDGDFAGRKQYLAEHGNYTFFDFFTAKEKGYLPETAEIGAKTSIGKKSWWGYGDETLYKIAKDELLRLSQSNQPFNFTMLTVDTHFRGGYICDLCGDEYDVVTANVVACADRQIEGFLAWCQEQDFYEDTVIIITGDHPRMDKYLVDDISMYDRTIYNCFLNCDIPAERTTNREFTATDMFPTILTAMGFQVEGDRLGLGTNMFSDRKTLCEELGYESLEAEFGKYSAYYLENFA